MALGGHWCPTARRRSPQQRGGGSTPLPFRNRRCQQNDEMSALDHIAPEVEGPEGRVTLVIVDLEHWSKLWDVLSTAMHDVMRLYAMQLRRNMRKCRGPSTHATPRGTTHAHTLTKCHAGGRAAVWSSDRRRAPGFEVTMEGRSCVVAFSGNPRASLAAPGPPPPVQPQPPTRSRPDTHASTHALWASRRVQTRTWRRGGRSPRRKTS